MKRGWIMAALTSGLVVLVLTLNSEKMSSAPEQSQESVRGVADSDNHTESRVPAAELPAVPVHNGEFRLAKGIKDVMDNLILAADSTDADTILQMAEQHCLQEQLSEAGCSEFLQLMQTYLDYKIALQSLEPELRSGPMDIAALRNQLQAMESLRRAWFTNEQFNALFAEAQKFDHQALARREIALSPTLSKDQKRQQITEHLNNLPPEQRQAFQPTLDMQAIQTLKAQYPDKQSRLLEVENRFGFEAAQRLAETWQQQASFLQQVKDIAPQYSSLTNDSEKLALLSNVFSGNELRRARALLNNGQY